MKNTMLRWLSVLLTACLLMGLPVALMEGLPTGAEAPVEGCVDEITPALGEAPAGEAVEEIAASIGADLAGAVAVESIELNVRGLVPLNVGETLQLSYTLKPKGAKADVEWFAQWDDVISVSDKGLVTALKAGTSFAIARIENDGGRAIVDAVDIKVIDPKMKPAGGMSIDEAHFPDPIFRNFVQFQYDTDNDGALSDAEIKGAYYIELNGSHNPDYRNIQSLEGIEYFKYLKELYLCQHLDGLTRLDLRKNKKLEILQCWNLDGMQEIATTGNTALKELFIDELPALKKLDIRKSTRLEQAVVNHVRKLTKLDVSRNTKLIRLELFETGLTALNVSKNTRLVELICQEGAISSLNVSKNKKLKRLNCGGNKLTKLDVSKNTALEWLDAGGNRLKTLKLGKNNRLTYVICCGNGNGLKKIDISGCKALVDLVCTRRPTRTGYRHIMFSNEDRCLVVDKDVIPELVGEDIPGVAVFTKTGKYTVKVGESFWIDLERAEFKSCKSSDATVATVKNGLVTPLEAGKTKLTITPKKGKKIVITLNVKG